MADGITSMIPPNPKLPSRLLKRSKSAVLRIAARPPACPRFLIGVTPYQQLPNQYSEVGLDRRASRSFFQQPARNCSFTIIELLVVVAIIGTLAGLVLPTLSLAREKGRRTACANNLRQIGIMIAQYAGDSTYSLVPYKTNDWSNHSFSNLQSYVATPALFHCPSDRRTPSKPALDWGAFTSSTNACSYSIGRNLRWGGSGNNRAVVMDRVGTGQGIYQFNSGIYPYFSAGPASFSLLNPATGTIGAVWTNGNHGSAGGNLLFSDGRVSFYSALPVSIVDYRAPGSNYVLNVTVQNPL